jgi:hypothetical protein
MYTRAKKIQRIAARGNGHGRWPGYTERERKESAREWYKNSLEDSSKRRGTACCNDTEHARGGETRCTAAAAAL